MTKTYSLKEISKLFQVPKSTLRYWETEGIITSSRNYDNDYREYTTKDLITISDIIFYRNLNIPVKLLKDLYVMDIQENEKILWDSIDDLQSKIEKLNQTKSLLQRRLNIIQEFKELSQGIFHQLEPPFDTIVHIHLAESKNIDHYLKDQTILAIINDFHQTDVYLYGTTDISMSEKILWQRKEKVTRYQPCLVKVVNNQFHIITPLPSLHYGKLVATYLISDKDIDYFKGWLEILT